MARNMMKRPKTLYAILTGDTTYEDAITRYTTRNDAAQAVREQLHAVSSPASDRLVEAVTDRAWREQEPVDEALGALTSAGWDGEGFGDVQMPSYIDLREEAVEALLRGQTIEVVRGVHARGHGVETLIIKESGRAGQAQGGNAEWGDYDPEQRLITLDKTDDELNLIVVDLDGNEVAR